ncbi:hypothetical protein [Helicobacter sp. T3_23-1059]
MQQPHYPLTLQEESLKQRVASEFFAEFDYEPLQRVDFALTYKESAKDPAKQSTNKSMKDSALSTSILLAPTLPDFPKIYTLWAEAKKGNECDIFDSLIQLILTIGAQSLHKIHNIPEFIGAFDAQKIAFLPYKYAKDFIARNDFDWKNITPSDYTSLDFAKMREITMPTLRKNCQIYDYAKDAHELRHFIKNSLAKGAHNPIEIDEENFDSVYLQWARIVLPSINLHTSIWKSARENLIALESDFFLADLLSEDNTTINQNLRILLNKRLENAQEKLYYNIKINKGLFDWNTQNIAFINDDTSAHTRFWLRYKRPPKEDFWEKIYERRDKLSPEDIRERKGAFFTPKIWVQKAQEYLAKSLGENWQDEYYIWDCAAGTGNLLAGLKNARNIYASTLDLSDVLIMKELAKGDSSYVARLPLLEEHIFQFDFLNDSFFDEVANEATKSANEFTKGGGGKYNQNCLNLCNAL